LDRLAEKAVILLSILPLLLALAILVGLALRASPILVGRNLFELLLGEKWLPSQGVFGFLPFLLGTIWVTTVAMFLAIPPSLFTAIYLAEYASGAVRSLVKPLLDLLAAIPSVVYGVWGLVAIVPWVQTLHTAAEQHLDFIPLLSSKNPTGFSILAGGIVLAVMVMPFIISVTYEVLHTVPSGAREASLALGATQWQTIRHAVIPQALPGILAGVVLGSSRALGETLAVLMVVGNVPQIPASIFDAAYPLPALIANNYGEMMSIPLYDSALLSAALILLVVVLFFNILSTLVLRLAITRRAAK
jgi:phosphate transport system permease protein